MTDCVMSIPAQITIGEIWVKADPRAGSKYTEHLPPYVMIGVPLNIRITGLINEKEAVYADDEYDRSSPNGKDFLRALKVCKSRVENQLSLLDLKIDEDHSVGIYRDGALSSRTTWKNLGNEQV